MSRRESGEETAAGDGPRQPTASEEASGGSAAVSSLLVSNGTDPSLLSQSQTSAPPLHNPDPPPFPSPASPPPPLAPAGFRLAAPEELRLGHRLVRSHILFYWPSDGWLRGRVTECRRRGQFTHVVSYPRDSPAAGKCSTLLDAESHGPDGRWVLLLPSHAPPP